jgi:hypothetical protein
MSAGLLDHVAGNSAPAPRNVPGGPRFAGLRTFATLLLIAGLIVSAIAANRAWTRYQHGNPDPHGHRLQVLLEARAALPDAQIRTASEPQWEPAVCHFAGSYSGWSDVTVSADAEAVRATAERLSASNTAMIRQGWRLVDMKSSPHPYAIWSKEISSQVMATAQLSLGSSGWSLYASAPPAARAAHGCP